ncbi:MAG TPA: hypothetical protein VLV48_04160 [Thermoanaerobaculia bacterium]|nr:hypothetical protein [Thermoanaerobaculia bacterium]
MGSLGIITIVGVAALAVLVWFLYRKFSQDKIQEFIDKRKSSSRVALPAQFVEANQRIPVALAVTNESIFYENADLEARLDLQQIDEVEYANDLFTGQEVADGRVLRLRSHGHAYEFIVDKVSVGRIESILPPHHADQPGGVRLVG